MCVAGHVHKNAAKQIDFWHCISIKEYSNE